VVTVFEIDGREQVHTALLFSEARAWELRSRVASHQYGMTAMLGVDDDDGRRELEKNPVFQ